MARGDTSDRPVPDSSEPADAKGAKARPPGPAVGLTLAVLALLGTAAASALAWRSQRDVVSTSVQVEDLQWRWTVALRDLEAAEAQLENLRARDEQRAEERRRAQAEIEALGGQLARLEEQLTSLRRTLPRRRAAPRARTMPTAGPVTAQLVPVDVPPEVTLRPVEALVFPASSYDAPQTATLVPVEPVEAPSAWLLPTPDAAPIAAPETP